MYRSTKRVRAQGQRIQINMGGNLGWALRVGGFVTKRKSSTDYNRYSLVVRIFFLTISSLADVAIGAELV
jgi:hypothetical protein